MSKVFIYQKYLVLEFIYFENQLGLYSDTYIIRYLDTAIGNDSRTCLNIHLSWDYRTFSIVIAINNILSF